MSRTDYFIILPIPLPSSFLPFRETLHRFARQPLTDAPGNYANAANTSGNDSLDDPRKVLSSRRRRDTRGNFGVGSPRKHDTTIGR